MNLEGTERIERMKILLRQLNVEEVLTRYDVEILERVESRKGGTELVCPCPFHPTTSGNFYINDENGKFICRSAFCGVKGDLIHFVSLKEDCGHDQAYKFLCHLAGIDPASVNPLAITMSILSSIGSRKQSDAIIRPSPIPDPAGYQILAHPYMVKARGIDPQVLIAAGAGGIFDNPFYQYRACVPVNMAGETYSIYARACGPVDPKHHYSGNSLTSHLLYGLDHAAEAGEGEVILVEAIISVLKLRTLGFDNAVAMMKSGVSEQQILRLIEHSPKVKRVIICSDNDEKEDPDTGETLNPGMKAAWNSYRRLKQFFDVGVARLPTNIDPADMDDHDEFKDVLDEVLWPSGRMKNRKEIERFFQER